MVFRLIISQRILFKTDRMPTRKPDRDGNYVPPDCQHYNVRFTGSVVLNRVTARYLQGMEPALIQWVWCVEERRELTKEEIQKLCGEKG